MAYQHCGAVRPELNMRSSYFFIFIIFIFGFMEEKEK